MIMSKKNQRPPPLGLYSNGDLINRVNFIVTLASGYLKVSPWINISSMY